GLRQAAPLDRVPAVAVDFGHQGLRGLNQSPVVYRTRPLESRAGPPGAPPCMKLLADFLPIILFFVAYQAWDIYVATAVAIAASAIQIAWTLVRGHRVEPMQWATLLIIVVFGGMTLFFRDE